MNDVDKKYKNSTVAIPLTKKTKKLRKSCFNEWITLTVSIFKTVDNMNQSWLELRTECSDGQNGQTATSTNWVLSCVTL